MVTAVKNMKKQQLTVHIIFLSTAAADGASVMNLTFLLSFLQIYSPDHTSSSFPSNPSTPVGSPSPLTATAGAASAGTVVTAAGTPSGRPGKAFAHLLYA